MPYPKRLINEGEAVALDLRPHWWFFSKHILTGIPLVIALVLITRINDDDVKDVLVYAFGGAAVIWAIWLLVKFLEWSRTYFVVTDQRVIFRTGILTRHGVEIPLERINNINFHQGIWERIIGAGDLEIQSAGEQGTSQFSDVRHPDGVQQEVYRQMEGDAKRDAGRGSEAIGKAVAEALEKAGGGRGASIPDQIEALAKLHKDGTITDAEFEKKKAELLDKM
jgi:uncharacterized membrane protein YdbT with pleckstrin-like domain